MREDHASELKLVEATGRNRRKGEPRSTGNMSTGGKTESGLGRKIQEGGSAG